MSTAVRRLALALRQRAPLAERPVLAVFGLSRGAGLTTMLEQVRTALMEDGLPATLVAGGVLAAPPDRVQGFTLVDGGALLDGVGPRVDRDWKVLLAGVVLVVVADEDRLSSLDEARELLAGLELPLVGIIWSERSRAPVSAQLAALWARFRHKATPTTADGARTLTLAERPT